jgi:hypothetical protein
MRAQIQAESLVVAGAEIGATEWSDRRTLAAAVHSRGVLSSHGLARRAAEAVSWHVGSGGRRPGGFHPVAHAVARAIEY